jgi:voltage-gated potassium channel
MGGLAVLFLIVVLIEPLNRNPTLSLALTITGYVLWATFGAEFVFRLWLAPDRRRFLKQNWWRALILVIPFLRLFALLRVLRITAFAQLVGSAVRGSRSAAHLLSGRLVRLGVFTAIVILVATHLTYLAGGSPSYPQTLHDVALTTIAGQPLNARSGVGQIVEVVLAAYSVLVFATLAGSIGAFFLDEERPATTGSDPIPTATEPGDQPDRADTREGSPRSRHEP